MSSTQRRIARELVTIRAMLRIYCRDQHVQEIGLCAACEALADYARGRLGNCPFAAQKPTCANCAVHCYQADMREEIRQVMRYAGPRMMLEHPGMALMHLLDGRRKAPARLRKGKRGKIET